MDIRDVESYTDDLENDLNWLQRVIEYQLGILTEEEKNIFETNNEFIPKNPSIKSYYGNFIFENKFILGLPLGVTHLIVLHQLLMVHQSSHRVQSCFLERL